MKKGIIITVVLVVIAIILAIVFVNLFKERDTTEMSNRVVSTVQDGYLNDEKEEGEFETINSYLDKVLATGGELTTAYRNEVQNFKTTYLNYTVIAELKQKTGHGNAFSSFRLSMSRYPVCLIYFTR